MRWRGARACWCRGGARCRELTSGEGVRCDAPGEATQPWEPPTGLGVANNTWRRQTQDSLRLCLRARFVRRCSTSAWRRTPAVAQRPRTIPAAAMPVIGHTHSFYSQSIRSAACAPLTPSSRDGAATQALARSNFVIAIGSPECELYDTQGRIRRCDCKAQSRKKLVPTPRPRNRR